MILHLQEKTAIKMTTSQKFKYKAEGYGKQWDLTTSITAYFTALDKFRTSLADCGILTSFDEMMKAAGAKMWESEMFTEDQMVAWEKNRCPADMAGSPRLLHREVVGTPPVFASDGKTLAVQGGHFCSIRNGSSRGGRRSGGDDVCSPTRATSGATQRHGVSKPKSNGRDV